MAPDAYLVPATVSIDRALDNSGHVGSVHLHVLIDAGADAAALASLAARLCATTPGLLGREGDVTHALTASLAPFRAAPASSSAPGGHNPVCLEVVARAGGVTLTDRVVVDLAAPPGTEGAASLGAAVARDAGCTDAVAAAYADSLLAGITAARAGRGGAGVRPVEDAAGWVPAVVRG